MLMYSKLWHFLNIILYQDSGVNAYQVPNEKQMMEITKKAFSAQSNLFIIGKSNTLNKTRSSEFKMDSPISIEVISKEECCESIIGLKSATKEIKDMSFFKNEFTNQLYSLSLTSSQQQNPNFN
ncbi:hypothetical protein RclHR1_06660007 [Rhizophagus clarus]|uniref:Uncharacterized protein n=1 Tax=Rhizophagus clarus TaxID=94130 RepID=A0A2Z6RTR8_9GLOM|nr:hypothetical protein RclHR1_06660007 [Rhizophagus clarus]